MTKEERYRFLFSRTAKFSALLIIFLLVVGWIGQGLFPTWRQHQREYRRMLRKAFPTKAERAVLLPERGIYQAELPELGRTDRCMTCHLAIEGAILDSLPEPFQSHPGDLLQHHPVKQFGCTICHGGQGQALDKQNAFARNPRNDWDQPVLNSPFIESSCGKCHLSLFSTDPTVRGSTLLEHGRTTFLREGCLGCHKARQVGGMLGSDLTAQGDKSRHAYNFRYISGEQTISNWLEQHFIDPEMVSPGSRMLQYDLPKKDLEALAILVMGLSKPDIPYAYLDERVILELKGIRPSLTGVSLYEMLCSACHGKTGEGKSWVTFKSGIPAIGKPGFLATVSREYLSFILQYGRNGQLMTPWAPEFSGLSVAEVNDLSRYLLSQRPSNSSWQETRKLVVSGKGTPGRGRLIYNARCRSCHGPMAKGGLALGFNNPDFFRAASLEYLYRTLFRGRMNTAMPSWSMVTDREMADLLVYISGLKKEGGGTQDDIQQTMRISDSGFSIVTDRGSLTADCGSGAERFHYLCSRCHGEHGEGATGPAILNRDFLFTVDEEFLYQTIAGGRAHTPMHGWIRAGSQEGGIRPEEIREVIAFMKSCADTVWEYNYPGPTLGNKDAGKTLFASLCTGCHGTHGTGLKAPSLNDQVFLNAATNGFLLATITLGRPGTEMPAWGDSTAQHRALTARERHDLAAFIRGWQGVHLPMTNSFVTGSFPESHSSRIPPVQ